MNRENKVVSFGPAAITGALRLAGEGGSLVVTPLPESPAFTARFDWGALPWKLTMPRSAEALDESGNVIGTEELRKEGEAIVLRCDPKAFSYRLR